MPQDEETITTTAAERRLGTALMWTGALLGAMFIAVLGLGYGYWNATANLANKHSLPALDSANTELTKQLATTQDDLRRAQLDLKTIQEKDGRYIEFLQAEYRRLARREPPKEPPPAPFDPLKRPQ
jgi:hypothetical protein